MATGTLWISRSNHPWSNFSPAEDKSKGATVSRRTLGPVGKLHGQCHTGKRSRATSPPRHCHQDLMAPTLCSSSGTKRSLSFHPLTSPLKDVSIFSLGKEPISSRTEVPPALAQASAAPAPQPGLAWDGDVQLAQKQRPRACIWLPALGLV